MELSLIIVKPALPAVSDSLKVFKSKRQEPVIEVEKPTDAAEMAINGLPCVIVMSIQEEADVIACLQMIKTISPDRKDKLRRVVVVSRLQNSKLNNSLLTRGAVDVLHDRIAPTAMVFKISLQLSQIHRLMKEPDDSVMVKGRAGVDTGGMTVVSGSNSGYQSTNQVLPNDIWFLRGQPPKKVGIQWVTDMDGPDPDAGTWEPVENESHGETWKWIPFGNDGKPSGKASSGWQFDGNRPVFDAETEKWRFVATKPRLSYQDGKNKPECKISHDPDSGLSLASDNPENESKISESKRLGDLLRKEREKGAPRPNVTLSASQLGTGQGDWETVEKTGWAYVTEEMNDKTPDEVREQTNIWTLDKAPGVRKPVGDEKGNNWTFSSGELPKCNETFADLSPPYQDFLVNRNPKPKSKMTANAATESAPLKPSTKGSDVRELTAAEENIRADAGEGLKFFFQLAKMVNENRSESEMIQKIVLTLCQILKLDNVTVIQQHSHTSKRHAQVVYSTHMKFSVGSVIDLESQAFPDALTDLLPKHQFGSAAPGISTYPLIDTTQTKAVVGSLILEYKGERQVQSDPNFKAVALVTKHLARILKPAKAA
jgi:hypothetical protein